MPPSDTEPVRFEQALAELERILRDLEDGTASLEDSLARYERGVALVEMVHPDAIPAQTPIPAEGAISEAVETAKTFCGADAPGFVNGVLAAIWREIGDNRDPHD